MKKIFLLLVFILSFNVSAIDTSIFKQNFPSFNKFQMVIFQELRNYFENLPANSLMFVDDNGSYVFKIKNPHNGNILSFNAKVERTVEVNQISERVIYQLPNGESLEYVINKRGDNVKNSEDLELLAFRFNISNNDQFYQILVPTYQLELTYSNTNGREESYIYIYDIRFKIENYSDGNEAQLNYILFMDERSKPQTNLTVTAIEDSLSWNKYSLQYTYKSELVNPKLFYQILGDITKMFARNAEALYIYTIEKGFPRIY